MLFCSILALAVPLWEQPDFLAAVAAAPDPVGEMTTPRPGLNQPRVNPVRSAESAAAWSEADALISKFGFLPDVSFSAGDASGRIHTLEKGKRSMSKRAVLASSSKFPAGARAKSRVTRPVPVD